MSSPRFAFIAVLLLAATLAFAQAPKQMSVAVKETQIRATPSYLGQILGVLAYGERVDVLAEQGGWARIALPAGRGQGWVNLSALTSKKVVLKAGSQDVGSGASSGEVALAGKGFNQEVENKYKQDNNLDYTWIDRMATFTVTAEQILAFLQQGELNSSLGGAQ